MSELFPGSGLFPSSSLFPGLSPEGAAAAVSTPYAHDLTSDSMIVPGYDARYIKFDNGQAGGVIDLIPDAFVEASAAVKPADRIVLSSIEGLYDDPVRRQSRDPRTDRHGTDPGPITLDERVIAFQGSLFAGNFPKLREMIGDFKRAGYTTSQIPPPGTLKFGVMRPPLMNGGTYEIDTLMGDGLFESVAVGTSPNAVYKVYTTGLAIGSGPTVNQADTTVWAPRGRSNTSCRITATHAASAGSTILWVEQQAVTGGVILALGDIAPMWFKALVQIVDPWATSMVFRVQWFRDFESTLPSLVRATDDLTINAPAAGIHLLKHNNLTPPRDAQTARILLRFESTTASDALDVRLFGVSASFRDSPIENRYWPGWSTQSGAMPSFEMNRDRFSAGKRTGRVNWAKPGRASVLRTLGEWAYTATSGLVNPAADVTVGKSLNPNTPGSFGYLFRVVADQPNDSTLRELSFRGSTSNPASGANDNGWSGRIPCHEGQVVRITARARVLGQESNASRTLRPNAVFTDLTGSAIAVAPFNDPVGNGADGLPAMVRAGTAAGDYDLYFERAAPAGSTGFYYRFQMQTAVALTHMEFMLDYITVTVDDPKHPRDPVAAYGDGDQQWWRWMAAQGTSPSYTQGQPDAYILKEAQIADFKLSETQPDPRIKRDFMLTVKASDPRFYEDRFQTRYATGPAVSGNYITQNNPGTFAATAREQVSVNSPSVPVTAVWTDTPFTAAGRTQARNSFGAPFNYTSSGIIMYGSTYIPSASLSSASRICIARVNSSRVNDGSWGNQAFPTSAGWDCTGLVLKRKDSTNYLYALINSTFRLEVRARTTSVGDQILNMNTADPVNVNAFAAADNLWLVGAVDPFGINENRAYFWVTAGHPLSTWGVSGPANAIGFCHYDFSGDPGLVSQFGYSVAGKQGWLIVETEDPSWPADLGPAPTIFSYEELDRSSVVQAEILVKVNSLSTIDFPINIRIEGPINQPRVDFVGLGNQYRYVGFDLNLAAGEFIEFDTGTNFLNSSMLTNHGFKTVQRSDLQLGSSWSNLQPGNTQVRLLGSNMSTASKLTVKWQEAYL